MVRRLPVYIMVNCSASMAGNPIASVMQGIHALHSNLMGDPSAVESAYLSVICFGRTCQQVTPLTELTGFVTPMLEVQSGTESLLGEALRLLSNCIHYEVKTPAVGVKGDWKPLVFLMTDSPIADEREYLLEAEEFRRRRLGNLIAVACGKCANVMQLRLLTETVLIMKDMSPDAFSQFFKWVSQSTPVEA